MRITIATGPIFPVPAVRGGAVQRLWEGLAREFAKRGHEVTIFAKAYAGQAVDETVDGVRFVRWGGYEQSTSIRRDLVRCLIYTLRAVPHVPRGDVVVANDFWMPAVLPWLKSSAGKVVVNANRFPKKQYWLYGKAAAFAAASAVVARSIKDQQPDAARRTVVVPNAIDEVFLEGTTGRWDNGTTGQRDGRRPVRILYVGRVHPEKGLGLLASALRLMADGMRQTADGRRPDSRGRTGAKADWECVIVGPVAQGEGGGGEAFAADLSGVWRVCR